ncbi:putative peptidoglycan binding domain protein [compost metagenome]
MQSLLLRRGYEIGAPDGKLGPKSRAAIIDWQAKAGVLPDGHAGGRLLQALQG